MIDLEFMWNGGNTKRYHTIPTLMVDTVGHHSYNVACIIMHLRPHASAALLRAALKHDMAEHKLGDMPAPAKRDMPDYIDWESERTKRMTFREVFGELEAKEMEHAGVHSEPLTYEEAWVLKFADSVDGMRFCIQEKMLGSRCIDETYYNFESYVAALLFGPDAHPLKQTKDYISEGRICDYRLFRFLKGKWYDLCK